jgi:hypothetical protein
LRPRSAAFFKSLERLEKLLARHPHELFERLDFGAFGLHGGAAFGRGALRLQFLDVPQARLEFFVDVAGHDDHFLDDLLLVEKFGNISCSLRHFSIRAAVFPCGPFAGPSASCKIFCVHLLVERADFFDELAQVAQMPFAIGDFFVHNHAVKAFLRRLGQKFFRDGNVFLGRETEAVNDAFIAISASSIFCKSRLPVRG